MARKHLTRTVGSLCPAEHSQGIRYIPYAGGVYKVEAGLAPLDRDTGHGAIDRCVFQFTGDSDRYLKNKRACIAEDAAKYYVLKDARSETMAAATAVLACHVQREWGVDVPANGGDPFHALAVQVPEDFCVVQVDEHSDRLVAAHVCAPSHWAPKDKIGKSFREIHAPVAGIDKLNAKAPQLSRALVHGRYKRLGWSLTTDDRLNHHPDPPFGYDGSLDAWRGKTFDPSAPELFVRIERQTLIGLPEVSAFVFTIRVYFRDCAAMPRQERGQLSAALRSMTPEQRAYKGINASFDAIVGWLDRE